MPTDRASHAPPAGQEPLSATERRARAAALRGLLLARQRRYDAAQAAFATAIRHDPTLDLTAVPTFWHLERGGQEAAVRAYQELGHERAAVELVARLRRTFRPRLVASSDHAARPGG